MDWDLGIGFTQRLYPLRPEDSSNLALKSVLTHSPGPFLKENEMGQDLNSSLLEACSLSCQAEPPHQIDESRSSLFHCERALPHFWSPKPPSHSSLSSVQTWGFFLIKPRIPEVVQMTILSTQHSTRERFQNWNPGGLHSIRANFSCIVTLVCHQSCFTPSLCTPPNLQLGPFHLLLWVQPTRAVTKPDSGRREGGSSAHWFY